MNNVVKQYLKECRRTFPFISKNEKLFFKRLEDNLNDIDENVTYKEICLKYGEPKNVMISYIESELLLSPLWRKYSLPYFVF